MRHWRQFGASRQGKRLFCRNLLLVLTNLSGEIGSNACLGSFTQIELEAMRGDRLPGLDINQLESMVFVSACLFLVQNLGVGTRVHLGKLRLEIGLFEFFNELKRQFGIDKRFFYTGFEAIHLVYIH